MESSWSTDEDSSLSSFPPTFETPEFSTYVNHTDHGNYSLGVHDDIIFHPAVQAIFYLVYGTIFSLGIFGNVLVCYVVGRNKAMQTVTNFFITNLALADILLCALAVPFTPLYTFLGEWIFGRILCHLVPYAQGTSVYISTMTLTAIAIDRYFVIIYPFKPRMRLTTCFLIITSIWVFALLATLPYGIFLQYKHEEDRVICIETWPSEGTRQIFSGCTVTLQFIFPFTIILFCYIKVSLKLSDRVRSKPGSKNSKKEALERERKRRTNRMLIAMVFIFGMSWLPLNFFNFLTDVSTAAEGKYSNIIFFVTHAVAMSSTCYNPFLYAWLNENFRKEFKQVLPCFKASAQNLVNRSKRFISQRTNCNGAETVQDTLMPNTSQATITTSLNAHPSNATMNQVLDTIEEVNSTSQAAPCVSVDPTKGTASYTASDMNEVIVHYPSPSFSSSSPIAVTNSGQENTNGGKGYNNNNDKANSAGPAHISVTIEAKDGVDDNDKDIDNKKDGSTSNKDVCPLTGKEFNEKESSANSSGKEAAGNDTMSPDTAKAVEEDQSSSSGPKNPTSSDAVNIQPIVVDASVLI